MVNSKREGENRGLIQSSENFVGRTKIVGERQWRVDEERERERVEHLVN